MRIREVTQQDENFPERLRDIKPKVGSLYYKGVFNRDIFQNCLAVVGTRRITEYGEQVTRELVHGAASAGITIVSGFMFGVDAAAHEAALEVGGRTIAVMPCGIESIVPAYQTELYNKILEKDGCIISEIEGDLEPKVWTFAKRNRIVAGLSQATLVVEGGKRSGTLITAKYALKYGRELLAVPGPITGRMGAAPNKLIKEGAKPVTCVEDILEIYHNIRTLNVRIFEQVGKKEMGAAEEVMEVLSRESMNIDEIMKEVSVEFKKLNALLIKMELQGKIKEESGKYYVN